MVPSYALGGATTTTCSSAETPPFIAATLPRFVNSQETGPPHRRRRPGPERPGTVRFPGRGRDGKTERPQQLPGLIPHQGVGGPTPLLWECGYGVRMTKPAAGTVTGMAKPSIQGHTLTFVRENWKPTATDDIYIGFLYPKNLLDKLKAKGRG